MDKALYAVVMEVYTGGFFTRKVDAMVEALGGASGISKSEVSRICQGLDEQVASGGSSPGLLGLRGAKPLSLTTGILGLR